MYLLRWFRLLDYLTLGLACGCLAYAEGSYMPGIEWAMVGVVVMLLLAWRVEGRWLLPGWGANLLSLFILGGLALWVRQELVTDDSWRRCQRAWCRPWARC
jgi:hypothetical protein